MPSGLILNVKAIVNDASINPSVNKKMRSMIARLSGNAKIESKIDVKVTSRDLKKFESETKRVLKSVEHGVKKFGKASKGVTAIPGYQKFTGQVQQLDHAIQQASSHLQVLHSFSSKQIKAAGGVRAYNELKGSLESSLITMRKLRSEASSDPFNSL